MKKSRDAFRTISEVSEWLDTPAHVLRFWESKFTQIKPVKRAGGRRYYRPQDMELLGGIKKLLHEDGMTIKGAQKLLRDKGVKYVSGLGASLDENAPAPNPAPEAAQQTVEDPQGTTVEDATTEQTDTTTQDTTDAPDVKKTAKDQEQSKRDDDAAIGDLFGGAEPSANVVPLHRIEEPVPANSEPKDDSDKRPLLLARLIRADRSKLAAQKRQITPLVGLLTELHGRMQQD